MRERDRNEILSLALPTWSHSQRPSHYIVALWGVWRRGVGYMAKAILGTFLLVTIKDLASAFPPVTYIMHLKIWFMWYGGRRVSYGGAVNVKDTGEHKFDNI